MEEDNSKQKRELINQALAARRNAYAPYSGFKVGAALKGESGKIYSGANVENASFSLTICAERSALFTAIAEGEKVFTEMVLIADVSPPVTPCGACLQVIQELAGNICITCANLQGEEFLLRVSDLIPRPFAP